MSKEDKLVAAISDISIKTIDLLVETDRSLLVDGMKTSLKNAMVNSLEKSKKEIDIAISRLKNEA